MISYAAKAWIALIGGIVTTLLGLDIIPTGSWRTGLTIAAAVLTSVITYFKANGDKPPDVVG